MTPMLPNPFLFEADEMSFDTAAFMEALEEAISPREDDIAVILDNLYKAAA